MNIHFEISKKNDIKKMFSLLDKNIFYNCISLSIENFYLTKKIYKKLSYFNLKELYIDYSFHGDYLQQCDVLSKNIEKLVVSNKESYSEQFINTICTLKNLKYLHLDGYINIPMKHINQILSNCKNIYTLYISFPYIDDTEPEYSYTNIKNLKCCLFENQKVIDIHKWFPKLEYLNIYSGEKFNIKNIDLLKDIKYLILKYDDYDENELDKIKTIHSQLNYIDIRLNRKESDIILSKKFDKNYDPFN